MLFQKKRSMCAAIICAILVVALPASLAVAASTTDSSAEAPFYNYYLVCTKDWDETDKKVELELYVRPRDQFQAVLEGGSFGLRFPKRMGGSNVKFVPNDDSASGHIKISAVVPPERNENKQDDVIRKDDYIFFGWLKNSGLTGWELNTNLEGIKQNLFIGTITFENVATPPFKTEIGQMDFLKMAESIPMELPESERGNPAEDAYNVTIWDPANSRYMGYYAGTASDATIQRTGVGLEWAPPVTWQNAFTVLSYNPNNAVLVELLDENGVAIADPISSQVWVKDSATMDSTVLYSATERCKNTGTGAYYVAIDFETFKNGGAPISAVRDTKYILRMTKPGHLTQELSLTATDTSFANCTGLPSDGAAVYLPAGDINPVVNGQTVTFGDGAIKLGDKSVLQGLLNGSFAYISSDIQTPNTLAWCADLDGDGVLSLGDLTILMASENYSKTASISIRNGGATV